MLNKKWFLYITEFFSGMSVMAVELGASRLLAPYFSSSQIVWTIIIGTIMVAMALGNVLGGRMADKNPNPDKLYMRIIIAGVWIAAIPFAGKYIIMGVSLALAFLVSENFLIWASFASCMIIFVFPLLILGTVTPSLVKFTVDNLDDTGKTVGLLGGLNTIGSIIGTFLPTFVTIPTVGTAMTFLIFASILIIIGVVYFAAAKRKTAKCVVAIVLAVIFSFGSVNYSFAFWDGGVVYEGESLYNYLQVKEDEQKETLSTNVLFGVQSIKMKNDSLTGMYYDYALAAPLMADVMNKKSSNVLILGLGTGTYASQCLKYFDNISVTGVEIDKKIINLADKYFDLPKDVKVHCYDGRTFLSQSSKLYDVIMVDAYQDITIPFQMSTVEFFKLVKKHLNKDGVMVVNMNMYSEKKGSINEHLMDTIASVFDNAATVDVKDNSNVELFATDNPAYLDVYSKNIDIIKDEKLTDMMTRVSSRLKKVEKGNYILTDDKAPVELLGMGVLDEIITGELDNYKGMLKGASIKDLLDMLK